MSTHRVERGLERSNVLLLRSHRGLQHCIGADGGVLRALQLIVQRVDLDFELCHFGLVGVSSRVNYIVKKGDERRRVTGAVSCCYE